jgi:hypothetical protein
MTRYQIQTQVDNGSIAVYCSAFADDSSLRSDLSVAELSYFDSVYITDLECYTFDKSKTWFFFNRLNVSKNSRGNGISHILLDKVCEIADEKKINIMNAINPYGELNLEQLIELYKKHGFILVCDNIVVREHK